MPNGKRDPGRRLPFLSLALLLLACAGSLYIGLSLVWQSRLPFDGVLLTELTPAGTSVSIIVRDSPLQTGDQVLSIDGYSIEELIGRALRLQPPLPQAHGQLREYMVLRDGETRQLAVPLVGFPAGRMILLRLGPYLLALLALLVSIYIFLGKPDETAPRLFLVAAASMPMPLVLHLQSTHLTTPALFVLENVLKALGMSLLFSGLLHLFLIFPVGKSFLRGRERWLLALHGINPLVSVLVGVIYGRGPAGSFLVAWQCLYWIGLVMLAAAVVSVVHTYITVHQPIARSQIRWVVWGSVVGILPFIAFTGIPEALTGHALLGIEITSFFVIAVPVTIAIAVARYRLFDIDTLIHRSLVYGLLMLLFTGLYLALLTLLNAAVLRLYGATPATATVFVSALAAATGFWALRARLVRLLAPFFYRTRVDPTVLLTEMSERLSHALRLDNVQDLLTMAIPARLGANRGGLLVLNEEGTLLEALDDSNLALPLETVQNGWANYLGEPIRRSNPAAWVPEEALAIMDNRQTELTIPLQAGGQIVGLWGLGALRSGQPYTSEEVRTLVTLARQAAVAVQNARLVRRMERQNQELEETVRRRTQVLEEERNRLDAILQSMADGLLVTVDGRVALTNPALQRMAHDVLRIPSLVAAIAAAAASPGEIQVHDLAMDGRFFQASITALGDRSTVVTLLRDITRETEVDRIKSAFISTVSHELRTPLTSILGFAKLIRRSIARAIVTAPTPDAPIRQVLQQVDRNLDIIAQEGDRLSTLVADALDLATLDSGEMQWKDQTVELPLLVQQAIGLVREEAGHKGLNLIVEMPQGLPSLVVDPRRVVQVLTNLLSNAIKFTQQGKIVLRCQALAAGTTIHGWQAPPTGGLLIQVMDSGIGIAPGELEHIFQRFYQAGDTLQKPQGTGLGLAICREIVQHYGGSIWAESAVGAGSSLYFTLPAAEEQVAV